MRMRLHSTVALAMALALLMTSVSAVPASAGTTRMRTTERFAMRLVNCLRTGGWVTRRGKCMARDSGRFSGYRTPLHRSHRISDDVSWPWARRTAIANICGHSLAGSTVDRRFRQAGLRSPVNGENIGCASGWTPRQMVITVLRWWQDEKKYGGSHWRQLKDRDFKAAGVSVVRLSNGRTRLVVNFYRYAVR